MASHSCISCGKHSTNGNWSCDLRNSQEKMGRRSCRICCKLLPISGGSKIFCEYHASEKGHGCRDCNKVFPLSVMEFTSNRQSRINRAISRMPDDPCPRGRDNRCTDCDKIAMLIVTRYLSNDTCSIVFTYLLQDLDGVIGVRVPRPLDEGGLFVVSNRGNLQLLNDEFIYWEHFYQDDGKDGELRRCVPYTGTPWFEGMAGYDYDELIRGRMVDSIDYCDRYDEGDYDEGDYGEGDYDEGDYDEGDYGEGDYGDFDEKGNSSDEGDYDEKGNGSNENKAMGEACRDCDSAFLQDAMQTMLGSLSWRTGPSRDDFLVPAFPARPTLRGKDDRCVECDEKAMLITVAYMPKDICDIIFSYFLQKMDGVIGMKVPGTILNGGVFIVANKGSLLYIDKAMYEKMAINCNLSLSEVCQLMTTGRITEQDSALDEGSRSHHGRFWN